MLIPVKAPRVGTRGKASRELCRVSVSLEEQSACGEDVGYPNGGSVEYKEGSSPYSGWTVGDSINVRNQKLGLGTMVCWAVCWFRPGSDVLQFSMRVF